MKIQSEKDFYSGVLFACVGSAFAWGSGTYSLGSSARMGAGYFPLILGVLLAVLGLAIAAKALVVPVAGGDKLGKFAWQPLIFIISANVVFGVCIGGVPAIGLQPLGLVVGIYLLTFVAAKAGSEFRFKEVLTAATILSVMSYFAFIVLLKLQFPVWPVAITG
jgi:hypothetical protein